MQSGAREPPEIEEQHTVAAEQQKDDARLYPCAQHQELRDQARRRRDADT